MGTEKFDDSLDFIITQLDSKRNYFADTFSKDNSGFLDETASLEKYILNQITPMSTRLVILPNPERVPVKQVQPDIIYV